MAHSALVRCGVRLMFPMVVLKAVAGGRVHSDACRGRQLCKISLRGGACCDRGENAASQTGQTVAKYVCRGIH